MLIWNQFAVVVMCSLTHVNLPSVQHVEVVSLVSLLDNHLTGLVLHLKHGVKYLTLLIVLEVAEQEVAFDGLLEGCCGFVVFGDDLQGRHKQLQYIHM